MDFAYVIFVAATVLSGTSMLAGIAGLLWRSLQEDDLSKWSARYVKLIAISCGVLAAALPFLGVAAVLS